MDLSRKLAAWLGDLVFRGPSGEARVTLTFDDGGAPQLLVVVTPRKGKPREKLHVPKRFQPELADIAAFQLADKALLDLFAKDFVGTGTTGGLELVLGTEIGPPMGAAFAIDEARGVAYLGDWGFLRKVDLATGVVTSLALGAYPAVREVRVGPDGAVWLLADRDSEAPEGPYRAPSGPRVTFGVLRLGPKAAMDPSALEERFVVTVPRNDVARICTCLAVARDGSMLVPDTEGLALVRADGTQVRTFSTPHGGAGPSFAALSHNGKLVAVTNGVGQIEVHDVSAGKIRIERLEMDEASSLVVYDNGTVDVGTRAPNQHFHRIPSRGPTLTITDHAAHYASTVPGENPAFVMAAMDSELRQRDFEGKVLATWPVLAGQRGSRVWIGKKGVYVHTGRGVLMRIDTSADPAMQSANEPPTDVGSSDPTLQSANEPSTDVGSPARTMQSANEPSTDVGPTDPTTQSADEPSTDVGATSDET